MSSKIGLLGGTFDPVHNGHVSIAQSFIKSGFIDALWVLLTPFPPHKKGENHASYTDRLKMLEKAFEGFTKLKISTVENELPKPSYTVQTIRHLKNEFPDTEFFYCMGEDSLSRFHSWKYHKEILDECSLLVAHRPDATHDDVNSDILSRTKFIDHDPVNISSTKIKRLISDAKPIKEFVPDKVSEIIEKKNLYR